MNARVEKAFYTQHIIDSTTYIYVQPYIAST